MTLGTPGNDDGKRYEGYIDAHGFPHGQGRPHFLEEVVFVFPYGMQLVAVKHKKKVWK